MSNVALISIVWICCIVYAADAVSWAADACPLPIAEDTAKENLHSFAAEGSPSGYKILSQSVFGRFSIASNGTLSSLTKLDFESTEKAYSLVIEAFEDTDPPKTANLTCVLNVTDVNDEEPKFDKSSYSVNIPNNVVKDTSLLTVSATDRDVSDAFNKVTYSIKAESDNANFSINGTTGIISAAYNITGPNTFEIIVVATDTTVATFIDEATVSMCIGCTSGSSSLEIRMFAFMTLVYAIVLM